MRTHDALASSANSENSNKVRAAPKSCRRGVSTIMKSPICDMLGIEFPLLAFSHCRDVVAAVSRAGGFGVLGATAHSPESIEQELKWIDDHIDGKPYGLDVLIPENISTSGEKDVTWKSLELRISNEHRAFTRNLLKKYGIELTTTDVADNQPQPFDAQRALEVLEASFRHPIRLIANALGVPPKAMIEMGKQHGVPVAALVGAKEHALRQVAARGWGRGLGPRPRQPRRPADAAAEHHQPRRLQLDRSFRCRRQCAGARSR